MRQSFSKINVTTFDYRTLLKLKERKEKDKKRWGMVWMTWGVDFLVRFLF